MARITEPQVQNILAYLWAQGYKAGKVRPLGPDMVDYLTSKGHTFVPRAEKKLREIPSSSFSSYTKKWTANDPVVKGLFGLDAYDVDSLYTKNLPTGRGIVLGTSPGGSPGGGAGRAGKPDKFNQTGWDIVNIESIVNDSMLHPDYLAKLQNLKGGAAFFDEFETSSPRYVVGSSLSDFRGTIPTISAVGATPAAPPTTPLDPEDEEEEEVVEEVIEEPEEVNVLEEFEDILSVDDPTVFLKSGDSFTAPDISERKLSSKAHSAAGGVFTVENGVIVIPMKKLTKKQMQDDDTEVALITAGKVVDLEDEDNAGEIVIVEDDGEEYPVVAAPDVSFVVDVEQKQVFIIVNGKMVPATQSDGAAYNFTQCKIAVSDPTLGGEITEVLLDGEPMRYGRKDGAVYEYGLPLNGVDGLPADCYESFYEIEGTPGAGEDSNTLMYKAKGKFYSEGGRRVRFGKALAFEYDFGMMDEKLLQPLALDFDTELDLENQGIVFTLIYQDPNDNSNLFPGFDVNSTVDTNQETFLFPNDVRNLRPINEDAQVMLQKFMGRKGGEGIEKIEIASSNLQGPADFTLDGETYNAEVYTQVKITFEDGETMLVPDGDERFKALDNSDSEIQGVVSVDESTERTQLMVITGGLDAIYEGLESNRRSNRLGTRFNRTNKDGDITSQTAMIKQGDAYYILLGVGSQTIVVEMDMKQVD